MNHTTALVWPLALAAWAAVLPSAGCIAPAVVSRVDPEACQIIAPGAWEASAPAAGTPAAVDSADAADDFHAPDQDPDSAPKANAESPTEPRQFAPATIVSGKGDRVSTLTPSLVAEQIPAVEPISQATRAQPAGHTLPPRVSLGQAPMPPSGEPTAELPTAQRIKPLRDISLDIAPPALLSDQQQPIAPPTDYAAAALPQLAAERPFVRGELAAAGFDWHPSAAGLNFAYQPLYFEEVNAERYGHSFGILQPAVSAVAFYGRIPLLPYMAFARPARRSTYHAHWELPGYKIPAWEPQPIVLSASGAAAELAVIYGLVLLIP